MRILVTGSNGFMGKYVCDMLKEEHELIGIGTKNSTTVPGIEYYSVNIEEESFVTVIKDKVKHCDIIIHLAAYIDKDNFNDKTIDVNCKGALHVVNIARELGVKKIINASGLPVIGKPTTLPITEEHKTYPNTLYHASKLMSEHIMSLASSYGIKFVNLRIPSPIGVGMNDNTILPVILKRCLKNEPIIIYGNGGREQNYIDVRDIAKSIAAIIQGDVHGTFNIASERVISNIQLAKLCIRLTGSSSEIIFNGNEDPQETYSWKTSIDRAKEAFSFKTQYTLEDTINNLLKHWEKEN